MIKDFVMESSLESLVSLEELCEELSISTATGLNWVKLGKIIPQSYTKRAPVFTRKYLLDLKSTIENGKNTVLKSRRNKRFAAGNALYNSYLSKESKNIQTVESIIKFLKTCEVIITEEIMLCLLADCAAKISGEKYSFLVEDLLCGKISSAQQSEIIRKYPKLFSYNYVYEKTEDVLGLLYISLRNLKSRKTTGAYYTPNYVVKKLCSQLFSEETVGLKILDPCCGTGNFILQLPNEVSAENVFAYDIDEISVKLARINYALKFGQNEVIDKATVYSHIKQQDFLYSDTHSKYDIVIGNPPWGFEYKDEEKISLKTKYHTASGSGFESYDLFIEKALKILNQGGKLAFVLPQAVLNVKSHKNVREIILQGNSIEYLEYLGEVFHKVQCPSIILKLIHNGKVFNTEGMLVKEPEREYKIAQNRLVSSESFNFNLTDAEYEVYEKILNLKNSVTLKGNSIFALGIVTGNNKKCISKEQSENNEIILKGSDIFKYRIIPSDNYITFNAQAFQQVAQERIYRVKEKLFYRFISEKLVFAYDDKKTLSLNSCNILIPQIEGLSTKYILAILNSKISQFYFKKRFNSLKVLRSHIESIPIPFISKKEQKVIEDLVCKIEAETNEQRYIELYEKIDSKVADLFCLNNFEYNIIKDSYE